MKYNTHALIPLRALRWFFFKVFNFIKNRQAGRLYSETDTIKILVFPDCKENEGFNELFRKISFAFPENDSVNFHLRIPENLLIKAQDYMQNLAASGTHQLKPLKIQSIAQNEQVMLKQYDLILCHKAITLPRIIRYFFKTEIIDAHFYSHTESIALQRSWFRLLDEGRKNQYKEASEKNFLKLSSRLSGRSHSCCFLTGPSISNFRYFRVPSKSVRIICNSLVKNDEFLDFIGGADIITFADPVFHFGASDYAIRFREKMVEVALKWDSYILVPDCVVPLLSAWFPMLKERIIGIATVQGDFHLPSAGNLWVRGTDNIFTMLMLPLAATFADKILVAGADGRDKDESYFWKFSHDAQFNEEMESAFKAHPSFFRDRKYLDYYKKHCEVVGELINYLEPAGKSLTSITPSQVPALAKRFNEITT